MTYTLTCPDPSCATTFELDGDDFDQNYEQQDEPIECPGCNVDYEWDLDDDREPPLQLTVAAEYDEEPETCDICGEEIDECTCPEDSDEETEDDDA
jgi:hypothetical protein